MTVSATTAIAQRAPFALDRYLQDSIGLDPKQLADIERGRVVTKVLPAQLPRDITVFGIVAVRATRDAYVARLGDIGRLQALRSAEFGIVRDSATPADLAGLSVDESDYRDLRDCKVNDCKFKLSEPTMRQFAQGVNWTGHDAKAQADSIMRADLASLISRYRASGNAAMVRYDDYRGTLSSEVFADLLGQSSYLRDYSTELRDYLLNYPARKPEGTHDAVYWSQEKISRLRRTLTLTHIVVYAPSAGTPVVARKLIYANHYFEGALELLAVFDAPPASGVPRIYLVTARRYRFDNLPTGGFLNIRGRVRDQLANLLRSDLEKERKASETP
jgi:hypothetical protein